MPVSEAKGKLETGARTFGIEVEFATHNYELLSFTHIEVCYLYPKGMPMERLQTDAWKIETDSDYTFELVSPILSFDNRECAENFNRELLQKLQALVLNGEVKKIDDLATSMNGQDESPLFDTLFQEQEELVESEELKTRRKLGYIMEQLAIFLSKRFLYASEKGAKHEPIEWDIKYINKDELLKKINWENWDDNTDLKVVLEEKKRISEESSDDLLKSILSNVLLYPSSKNNYFCDSQMNVPQTLEEYVTYEAKHKLVKAIKRKNGEESTGKQYANALLQSAPEWIYTYSAKEKKVSQNSKSILINKYNAHRIQRQRYSANKYYAWLRVFSHATEQVVEAMSSKGILKGESIPLENSSGCKIFQVWSKPIYQVIYLIVQKHVFGTLGQLSETPQMDGQKEIMAGASKTDWDKSGIDKNGSELAFTATYKQKYPFLEYYSYVKDLTPLWFKAPLMDVLEASNSDDQHIVFQLLLNQNINITQLVQDAMKETEARVKASDNAFTMLDVEGNKNAVEDAYNSFFCTMKQTEKELRDYLTTRNGTPTTELNLDSLEKRLECGDNGFIALAEDAKGLNIEFLRRQYPVSYGSIKSSSLLVNVAPWEARWDTLKAPIDLVESTSDFSYISKGKKYYLVEHRNN